MKNTCSECSLCGSCCAKGLVLPSSRCREVKGPSEERFHLPSKNLGRSGPGLPVPLPIRCHCPIKGGKTRENKDTVLKNLCV